jgi:HEPN domain-containing protein
MSCPTARHKLSENDSDAAITSAVSSLESTFKITLKKLNKPYPSAQQVTNLLDVTKKELHLGDEISAPVLKQIIGSCTGAVSGLGGLRNKISDAH